MNSIHVHSFYPIFAIWRLFEALNSNDWYNLIQYISNWLWNCSGLSKFRLLIYFCCFVPIILVILCPSLCVSVFTIWSLFLDYIIFIFVKILGSLINLLYRKKWNQKVSETKVNDIFDVEQFQEKYNSWISHGFSFSCTKCWIVFEICNLFFNTCLSKCE